MKILFLSQYSFATGAFKRQEALVRYLSHHGHNITFVSPLIKQPIPKVNYIPLTNYYTTLSILAFAINLFNSRKKIIIEKPDVVVAFSEYELIIMNILLHQYRPRLIFFSRADVIANSLQIAANYKMSFWGIISKIVDYIKIIFRILIRNYAISLSDKTIFQTQILKAQALMFCPLTKTSIHVLPNNSNADWMSLKRNKSPIDDAEVISKWSFKNVPLNQKRIAYIGKVNTLRFGIINLIKLIQSFPPQSRPTLDIYGECQDPHAFEEYIQTHKLNSNVVFHGFVSNPLDYIASCDLLILNRAVDHNPNVILESFNIGIPVLCSDIPAYWYLIKNDLYRFNIHDSGELREKAVRFLTEPDFAISASKEFLQISQEFHFDWPGIAAFLITTHRAV